MASQTHCPAAGWRDHPGSEGRPRAFLGHLPGESRHSCLERKKQQVKEQMHLVSHSPEKIWKIIPQLTLTYENVYALF